MFEVRQLSRSRISLKADPDTLDDLVWLLSELTSLAKRLRTKARHIHLEQSKADPAEKERQRQKFNDISSKVYLTYSEALKAEKSKREAIQEVKLVHGIGYYDAEIYIAQGKRLEKARIRQSQIDLISGME